MEIIKVPRTFTKGIVISKAFLMKETAWNAEHFELSGSIEDEIKRYNTAVQSVGKELEGLAEKNEIFQAHLSLVTDPVLTDEVIEKIKTEQKNAEAALEEIIASYIEIFLSMDDEYMRERSSDIKDIGRRIMLKLQNRTDYSLTKLTEPVIVIAKDLTPSDTANMNLKYVAGFITEEGGVTSHVTILAKMYGIPALTGAGPILCKVKEGDTIAFDAKKGEIIIRPDEAALSDYRERQRIFESYETQLKKSLLLPASTTDGHLIDVFANVGSIEDIRSALAFHIDGIGLFRTEFLYMQNTHFPTEEEQFTVYKEAAELMGDRELIIRTLDIGGDKGLPYFQFEQEDNPFLGYRAIRMCLDKKDIFRTQLRALLRASAYGNIRIMYPMIISPEELAEAESILSECKQELDTEAITYNKNIITGMMIETPASVSCADIFAKKTGFFSIGTNDLTQYTLAVDRGNQKTAHMYDAFHPAVLRNIAHTITESHKAGIKTGMCGEFASDPRAVKLLIGMGIDELSMSAGSVSEVKAVIQNLSYEDAKNYAKRILSCSSAGEVHLLLENGGI